MRPRRKFNERRGFGDREPRSARPGRHMDRAPPKRRAWVAKDPASAERSRSRPSAMRGPLTSSATQPLTPFRMRLGAARVHASRQHGDTRCEGLEVAHCARTARSAPEARRGQRRRVEPVDIGPWCGPDHAVAESEPRRLGHVGRAVSPAGHDQTGVPVADGAERFHERAQALALEARAHEEHAQSAASTPSSARIAARWRVRLSGVKRSRSSTVVDEGHALGRRAVQPLDLGFAAGGNGYDAIHCSKLKDTPF